MKVIRSWPAVIPENRCYVVDTLPRFEMSNYCYRGLGDIDDDILLLEWDTAVSREDLALFIEQIRDEPERVHIALYRTYMETEGPVVLRKPVWAARRYNPGEQSTHFVTEDDTHAHMWPLGMTYLPRPIVREFLDDWPGMFNDTSLSGWHYRNVTKEVPIAWDVRPVHLHYEIERMGAES